MTPFEAVNHAMSLISTGGFSTSDASLGHWTQPAIHWVAVVIMPDGAGQYQGAHARSKEGR
jgi:trk system potassium uptake protein TrkH